MTLPTKALLSDSLIVQVPYDHHAFDIERQLALFLLLLDKAKSSGHGSTDKSASLFENLPPSLHQLVHNHAIRRKAVHTKKTLLFCLAGLVAENIYRYRDRHNTLLADARQLKTRSDADARAAALLKEYGFHYKVETIRRGRSRFRREFLDRVPAIFGLDKERTDDNAYDR